jgi:Cu(I)/Ag(I) efflux system membrane protein CusA/SilA
MIASRIIGSCARRPWLVVGATALAAVGAYAAQRSLARDAIPDLSDPRIGVVAEWMGHPAPDIADRVTRVLTAGFDRIPGATAVRGQSMGDMAYVDVVFGSESALTAGRAEIVRRLAELRPRLPGGAVVTVGPAASATGWVLQYALIGGPKIHAPMGENAHQTHQSKVRGVRKFQDLMLRPAIEAVPGVAEVATLGGETNEVVVQTSADQLRAANVALSDVVAALRSKMASHPETADEITRDPLLAKVTQASVVPTMAGGEADVDGSEQVVIGTVIAKRDADPMAVIRQVREAIEEHRHHLPESARIHVLYDRSELAGRVEHTLVRAVTEEVAVVAFVVLLFLLHPASALVPMITLPLIVLLTFAALRLFGVPATVMSLGGIAIALGMAVDADLVALEACHRALEADGGRAGAPFAASDRRRRLVAAAGSLVPAILTSLLIAALAFVPVFAFGGETGRLLRPLALSKTVVVLAGALVTLTLAPALRDRLVRGRIVPELRNPLTAVLVRAYRPLVHFVLARPAITLVTAALLAISCLPIVSHLGSEFLPRIDEGELLYMPTAAAGLGAVDAHGELTEQDRDIAALPGVQAVFGKIGRSDSATDPAPFSMTETTIRLTPRASWPRVFHARWYSGWAPEPVKRLLRRIWPEHAPMTTDELVEHLDAHTVRPGWTNAWTAPVRARMDMMSTGVRTPVGVRVVAADPARLAALGAAVEAAVRKLPGTRSAVYEGLGGERRLGFELDTAALARWDVDPARALAVADFVATGGAIGEIPATDPHAKRAVPVRLALDAPWLHKPPQDVLRDATVRAGRDGQDGQDGQDGKPQPIPLAFLGRPKWVVAPAMLRSEHGELCGYVHVDLIEGTDLEGYLAGARGAVAGALALAPGERIDWIGQYELLVAGQRRLALIVPAVALLMLGLLWLQFRSLTQALIVMVSVPFALVGSFWTLYLLGYRLSAPVWVGLLSVVGLAMQTGVVMVVYIDDAFKRRLEAGMIRTREDIVAAHAEGTVRRLRPKLMTIVTMTAALLPLLWARGAGAEIMRRVAAPMIGGLVTSAFLTLEVIPVLYTIWRTRQLAAARGTWGAPAITGAAAPPESLSPSPSDAGQPQAEIQPVCDNARIA